MIFYTADLHFGSELLLKNAARPFASVEEMDRALIENWNDTVTDEDTVYLIGDIQSDITTVPLEYVRQLKGHKHLIRGNHDTGLEDAQNFFQVFESVTDFWELDDGEDHVILCHYPIIHNKKAYMIHGHIHNRRGQAFEMLKELPHVLNAGVDINFYRPVTLQQLIRNNEMFYSEKYPILFPQPPEPPYRPKGFGGYVPNFKPLPEKPE